MMDILTHLIIGFFIGLFTVYMKKVKYLEIDMNLLHQHFSRESQ